MTSLRVLARRWAKPAAVGLMLAVVVYAIAQSLVWSTQGGDAHAYWAARGALYAQGHVGGTDEYLYSPAFAQALTPLQALDWPTFHLVWAALAGVSLAAVAGPLGIVLVVTPPVGRELIALNVHLLIALVVVAGFRRPWLWAFILLTKVTPGVGLLWFAARGEWRKLAIALSATAIVASVSFVLAPDLWFRWADTLRAAGAYTVRTDPSSYLDIPLLPRLLVAAVVTVWGARTGRPWTVPIAVTLAMPVIWIASISVLAACWPLRHRVAPGAAVLPAWPFSVDGWRRRHEAASVASAAA